MKLITRQQGRAARTLLRWPGVYAEKISSVQQSRISHWEIGRLNLPEEDIIALKATYESGGAIFQQTGGVIIGSPPV